MLISVIGLILPNYTAYLYGLAISVVNIGLYYGFYARYRRRIAVYPAQALVVVIVSTVTRFLLVGMLLVAVFRWLPADAKTVMLGFVVGQVYFLLNHLTMVATNNVK